MEPRRPSLRAKLPQDENARARTLVFLVKIFKLVYSIKEDAKQVDESDDDSDEDQRWIEGLKNIVKKFLNIFSKLKNHQSR